MKRNYFFNLLLSVSNILFPIISFPYVSKMLGPIGIGRVQFVTSYAQYFGLIAALGIPLYGVREIAKQKHDKKKLSAAFSELSIIYFITSLSLGIIYLLTIVVIPYFSQDRNLFLWSIALVVLSFSSIDWFYEGLEEFKTVAIRSVAVRLFSLLLMFILIRQSGDYFWYLLIIIFTTLANNAVNLLMLRTRVGITLSGLNLKRHLKPLLFIFSTTIATSMYTMLDTVLLGFLSDNTSVGLYTAAVKLAKIALPIVTSLGLVLVPRLAKTLSDENTAETQLILNKSFGFTAFFSVPLCFGLCLLAPEFITAFSSSKFIEATLSMQILSMLPLLIGYGYFFGFQILIPGGRDKEMLFSVCGGVVSSLLLNFLLVPHFKHVGASIANVGSELIVTSLYIYFVQKHFHFKFSYKLLLSAFLSALLFIPIVIIARHIYFNVYVRLMISVASCAAAYVLTQKLLFKNVLIKESIEPYILSKLLVFSKLRFEKK